MTAPGVSRAMGMLLLLSLSVPLTVNAQNGKDMRPARNEDFEGIWIGYGASGNYFYRLALTNGLSGEAVLVHEYDKTCRRYRVELQNADLQRWAIVLVLVPETKGDRIALNGRLLTKALELTAQGSDWNYEVCLWREDVMSENIRLARQSRDGVTPGQPPNRLRDE